MSVNNFKPFAIGSSANVTSQADYEALAALAAGFSSGKASSAQINKALRQGTVISSVLAQFISDTINVDVLDDGATATILSNLKAALMASSTGRLANTKVFTASGTYTPTAGVTKVRVKIVGGGGAGGGTPATASGQISTSYGGNGGSYGQTVLIPITGISSVAVIVGSGGSPASAGNGAAGGTSSFGAYIVAPGGIGGAAGVVTGALTVGTDAYITGGCTGPSIEITYPGGTGVAPINLALSTGGIKSGSGGNSPYGYGGSAVNGITAIARNGTGFGTAGGGSAAGPLSSALPGGSGTGGLVSIEEYF